MAFFAEAVDEIGQFLLRQIVDQVGRRGTARAVQAHVERPVDAEGQAAPRVGHLVGGEAQIRQQQVGAAQAEPVQDCARRSEPGVGDAHAHVAAGGAQVLTTGVGVARIEVEADVVAPRRQTGRDLQGVAGLADGAVQAHGPRLRVEQFEHLFDHHRDVRRAGLGGDGHDVIVSHVDDVQ